MKSIRAIGLGTIMVALPLCSIIIPDALSAQSLPRDLDREILVFILPDSLELPAGVRDRASLDRAAIRSASLSSSLRELSVAGIARSFPDWVAEDTVRVREDGVIVRRPRFDRVFTIHLPAGVSADEAIAKLESLPSVMYAEKHMEATLSNDPQYSVQWHLNNTGQGSGTSGADISAEQAWQIFTGSSNIKIGIFDTGVELNHNEFTGKISGDNISGAGYEYAWSHGTHVAGIAAAKANNSHAGRGVDWNAQIVSKQIFNGYGSFFGNSVVADKITQAVDSDGVHVLNHSWGGTGLSTTVRLAFGYAYMMNRVSVAAMGNDYNSGNAIKYPAAFGNGVIAVGATQNTDQRSSFSQTGNHIRLVAPGGFGGTPPSDTRDVLAPLRSNSSGFLAGTSMATPIVSGIASLLKGYNTSLFNDDIQNIIQLSADKVSGMSGQNWTQEYGYGRVNAHAALQRLQSPWVLNHHTATGGTVHSTSTYTSQFYGSGLAIGVYNVKRYEVRKNVSFSTLDSPAVWGRGAASTGYSAASPIYEIGYSDVVSMTNSTAVLRTYVYQVWTLSGQYLGYYPSTPANAVFAYTVHGIPAPLPPDVYITGPSNMFQGSSDTFTANVSGGTSPYSYQWYYMNEADGGWTTAGSTSSTYWHTAGAPNGETVRVVVTDAASAQNEDSHFFTIMGFNKEIAQQPVPDSYQLHAAYPNPFNPSSVIRYDLPEAAHVSLRVYNVTGQWVATLTDGQVNAGFQEVSWDAARFPSGMYILRMQAVGASGEAHQFVQKLTLLK